MLDVPERIREGVQASPYRLNLLGRFRLDDSDGHVIPVRSRKARALLTYLLLSGHDVGREQIAALLWSDRGEEQARASVRQALHELRRLDWPAGRSPLRVIGDTIALDRALVVSDLEAFRQAAAKNDTAALLAMLTDQTPDNQLLGDLDGLDPEYDDWLRQLRGREPGHTIDYMLGAAERAFAAGQLREAHGVLAALECWDPIREDVARLQFRVAYALQKVDSLERRWCRLVSSLGADLNAAPSPATLELYQSLKGCPTGRQSPERGAAIIAPSLRRRLLHRAAILTFPLIALTGSATNQPQQGRQGAPQAAEPLVLAIMPFEQQPDLPAFLPAAMSHDLRTALARNPGLRLLGRTTSEASAAARLTPVQWRQRTGADYVLGGMMRRRGADLQVSVELIRASDGLLVWSESFRESSEHQGAIVQSIEGRLRSRLAPGGGRRAEHITTSATVRALYGEARTLLSGRRYEDHVRARSLLREAVARDPNYAPAWAALAKALHFSNSGVIDDAALRTEGREASRRALALAPDLAEAHAVAGLLEGVSSATAISHLRRAIELDPSSVDAWNWLGNALSRQGQPTAGLDAYGRAVRLDPLFWPALMNLAQLAGDLGRPERIDDVLKRAVRAGAEPDILTSLRAYRALAESDLSAAAQALSRGGLDDQGRSRPATLMPWIFTLERLNMLEPLHKLVDCPPWYPDLLRGKIEPPMFVEGKPVAPVEFWMSFYFSHAASRSFFNHGKTKKLVGLYRDGFGDADRFIAETRRAQQLTSLAPTLAMALKAEGAGLEARYLLAAAERDLGPTDRMFQRDDLAELAAIKAAQGEHRQALALLDRAVSRHWLPGGRTTPLDLSDDPAFRDLRGLPHFEKIRRNILATIARERSELGPLPFDVRAPRGQL